MPFCYLVECADGTYYVGCTDDLERRLWQHNETDEGANYTRKRRPVTLVWSIETELMAEAYIIERRLHGWSRAKKKALIDGRFDLLPGLASRARKPRG